MPARATTFDTGKTALNLGNGNERIEDSVNLDITLRETRPVENIPATMEEIQRISRPGAIVHITVPHFSSANAFTDSHSPSFLQQVQHG